MDESTKKACFDEISHQICDADGKVNINDISSNWKVNLRDSERLLWQWHEEHKHQTVSKEFIVRGIDAQGHCVITVIKESQLPAIEKVLPKFSSSLFSLELPAKSPGNRLGTHQLSTSVVVNLPLEEKLRHGASTSAVVPPAPKPVSISNGLHKPAVAKVEPKVEPKPSTSNGAQKSNVSKSEPQPSPPKTKHDATVKPEPAETPTKQSPKKVSPKSGASSKAKPAAATGRSAISSFFSKPAARNGATPSANGAPKNPPPTANGVAGKKALPPSPVDLYTKERLDTSSSGNEMSVDTPKASAATAKPAAVAEQQKPVTAAAKPNLSAAEKRKRALADLLDSDNEDDQCEANGVIPPTQTQGNSKRKKTSTVSAGKKRTAPAAPVAPTSDEDIPGTPQADVTSGKKPLNGSKAAASRVRQICDSSDEEMPAAEKRPNKRKAKRTVTRTYEDEDGYIKTVKETEEYTCSEDENTEQNVVKPANGKPAAKVSPAKNAAAPKKITPPNKQPAKQGSIMSFFKKK